MRSILFVAAFCAALPAAAAPPLQPEVTVTATRRSQTVDDALASVTVITREDIERSLAPDLPTLLRGVAGVDLSRTGGEGQQTSVFLRGSNANQVLVLIDGVRVASANTGAFAWEHLPLGQIERIEVVRGPRASWHGSDAVGGVIQVFTRDPRGLSATMSAGRYGRLAASASYGAGDADASFGVTLGGIDFDGYSAQLPGSFGYDPDDDGYINRNLGLRAQRTLGGQRLALHAYATHADVDFDQGRSSVDTEVGGVELGGDLGTGFGHRLAIGLQRELLSTPVFANDFRSRRASVDWTGDLALSDLDSLVFGLNWQRERGESRITGVGCQYCESRRNLGAFASLQGGRERIDWQLAARHDDAGGFGGATTGQAALGFRPTEGLRTFASFGQGFRAPNLNELFSPGFGGLFGGNPALEAERSRSAEAGVDFTASAHRVGLRAFRTRTRDLIAFQGGATFQAVNIARAAVDGAELTWAWDAAPWRLDAAATWQDAEDATTGDALLRRPQRKLSMDVERELGAWTLGAGLYHASERRDFAGELAPYTLLDLRASWRFAPAWRLGLRLDNVTDRDYQLASGFATPGRALQVNVRYATD
jgi:vitamin B12 transporter